MTLRLPDRRRPAVQIVGKAFSHGMPLRCDALQRRAMMTAHGLTLQST